MCGRASLFPFPRNNNGCVRKRERDGRPLSQIQVLELRPNVDWNKGNAVNWILEALELGNRSDVFPIYLGDDLSDEDAFVVLENR